MRDHTESTVQLYREVKANFKSYMNRLIDATIRSW